MGCFGFLQSQVSRHDTCVGKEGHRSPTKDAFLSGFHICWLFCCLKDPQRLAMLTEVTVTIYRCYHRGWGGALAWRAQSQCRGVMGEKWEGDALSGLRLPACLGAWCPQGRLLSSGSVRGCTGPGEHKGLGPGWLSPSPTALFLRPSASDLSVDATVF